VYGVAAVNAAVIATTSVTNRAILGAPFSAAVSAAAHAPVSVRYPNMSRTGLGELCTQYYQ
jgi:hypothetical protein